MIKKKVQVLGRDIDIAYGVATEIRFEQMREKKITDFDIDSFADIMALTSASILTAYEDQEPPLNTKALLHEVPTDELKRLQCEVLSLKTDYYMGKPAGSITEDKVYDFYQERSVKAGERADQLAWMFIVMMTGGLISGHAFQTFSICAMLAAIYMLLSVVQAVWQTFTSWLFKNIIHRTGETPEDYPSWVGGGAWFFFWAKMITIASAVIYFAKAILF